MSGKTLLELFPGQNGWDIRLFLFCSVFCSVAKSCLTFGEAVDCSTPGLPVLHHLPELAQTHVHWVSDAIQPSHPLLPPFFSCPVFPSIRVFSSGRFFTSGGQSIEASASVLPMNIQGWYLLGLTDLISSLSKDSQESSTPQFEGINSSGLSLSYCPALTSIHDYWKNHRFDYIDFCQQSDISVF